MAKRKGDGPSPRARRPAKRTTRPAGSQPRRSRAAATTTAPTGSRRAAEAPARKKAASRRRTASPPAPPRTPQETTGRGAAQPGGRRTVELFEHAPETESQRPTLPSSLDFDQRPSAARSGRAELEERYREHPESGPDLTGGDVDADWQAAYSLGDEAPGGDNPTPGQAVVEDLGRSLGVEYEPEEELVGAAKISSRDEHRWELDPASSEDYPERTKGGRKRKG